MTDDATEEIMQATYCALCKHGYAALTMQDIADESSKSKAALHYHFDTKEALLRSFLEYLFEAFQARLAGADDDAGPAENLVTLVDTVLTPPRERAEDEFRTALLEIKAQAPYDDAYRERLAEFDRLIAARVRDLVAEGVETGVFRDDVDPAAVAEFVATTINGAHTRCVATGHPVETTRRAFVDYVDRRLVAADAEVVLPAAAQADGETDGDADPDAGSGGGVPIE